MALTNTFIKDFFSYKRPHGSETEWQWVEQFIIPKLGNNWWQDEGGNIHYDSRIIPTTGDISRTLFVSHVDTVHRDAGRQKVSVGKDNIVRVVDGECLGADDGAGALVLLALIEAKVPAYYIFTRCEERGGMGAKHLADKHAGLLSEFDRAIAFDRRGTSSVITHQGWGRCCSDTFADALSDLMSYDELMFAPDDSGVYTDTAEFVNIIPECTNISVGYMNEHTKDETLDLRHLQALIDCAVLLDWESLPVERDPLVVEETWMYSHEARYTFGNLDTLGTFGAVGTTEYNCQVYEACEEALDDNPDYLLWLTAEALNPADPDEVYEVIWNMPLPEYLIKNCMRQVDYATDDEQTERALVDLYQAVINDNVFQ
jgi:hypothetical protein